MKNIKKLIVSFLAFALCLAAGCGKAETLYEDSHEKILSSDDADFIYTFSSVDVNSWNVGDTVELFGYGWTAIDVEEGNTLLICNTVLPDMAFDTELVKSDVNYNKFDLETNWASSSVRKYLNSSDEGGFLFGENTSMLLNCTTYTERNSVMGLGEGVTEEFGDKVFLLSETEYKEYKEIIRAIDSKLGVKPRDMWLRTSGGVLSNAAVVLADGELNMYGYRADFAVAGVRPCIRILADNNVNDNIKEISASLKVGELIELGNYEQDGNPNTTDRLVWRVIGLSDDKTKALIITEQVVFASAYKALPSNNTLPVSAYADSDIHSKLNGEFLAALGNDASLILNTSVLAESNPVYSTEGGSDVSAKIFLPSAEEYNSYLKGKGYVTTTATEYAKENGASVDRQFGTSGYWMRNPGEAKTQAMYVYYYGGICDEGALKISEYIGVRPCAWINVAEQGG